MGDGVLAGMSKGRVLTKVDALANHRDASGKFDRREAFLAALKDDGQDYLEILLGQAGITPADATYLRATWYNPGQDGWWHALQPIGPVMRHGLIKALGEATTRDLPLDSYWNLGGRMVEISVAVSPYQVTRLIHTPPCPAPTRNRTRKVPIWRLTPMNGETEGQETFDEVVETVTAGIAVVRRKEPA